MVLLLDDCERRILMELQSDARLTNQELAARVGLSPSPCWRRVRALEEAGVIRSYTALLDPRKSGMGENVFCHVTLKKQNEGAAEKFEYAVKLCPEIIECYSMMGGFDYMIKVVVDKISTYDSILRDLIFNLPFVSHVRSNFALREIKYETALPLAPSTGDGFAEALPSRYDSGNAIKSREL